MARLLISNCEATSMFRHQPIVFSRYCAAPPCLLAFAANTWCFAARFYVASVAVDVAEGHKLRNVRSLQSVDKLRQTGCVYLFPMFEPRCAFFVGLLGELRVNHRRTDVGVAHVMLHVDDRLLQHR